MGSPTYNWRRRWRRRPSEKNTADNPDGARAPGDARGLHWRSSDSTPFEELATTPCLALLGEPGMGKTTALRQGYEEQKCKVVEGEATLLWHDLADYPSEELLVRSIFATRVFQDWRTGEHKLYLFLDSLDEVILRLDKVVEVLRAELSDVPISRLYLRIPCRGAEWPKNLDLDLKSLWGEDAYAVYELEPLTVEDINEAVAANGQDPETFLMEVRNKRVEPLATRPITLKFLIASYNQSGQFPQTQTELYLRGCRTLCHDPRQDTVAGRRRRDFSPDELMMTAGRIAALTVLSNRPTVELDPDQVATLPGSIDFDDFVGGSETVAGIELKITERVVSTALSTALFTTQGSRAKWAHRTYAEYLAAWYLTQHNLPLPQIISLIVHPGDSEGRLVPQLHETAAWLAGMRPELFTAITGADPQVLLRSDVETLNDAAKAALTATLLQQFAEGRLVPDWYSGRHYRRLAHATIDQQLRPYLLDANLARVARYVAIEIASACNVNSLENELADIALDAAQSTDICALAAEAVAKFGSKDVKLRLRPLLTEIAGERRGNDLKAHALRALWPDHMTTDEVFAVITPPTQQDPFGGSYRRFLDQDVIERLRPADLPAALRWLERWLTDYEAQRDFVEVGRKIIALAWENMDSRAVIEGFAAAVLRLSHKRLLNLSSLARVDNEKRRRLIEAMLPLPQASMQRVADLADSGVLATADLDWLIVKLQAAESDDIQQSLVAMLVTVFDWFNLNGLDAIAAASQSNPLLAEVFMAVLQPDSPQGHERLEKMRAREELSLQRRALQEARTTPQADPKFEARIEDLLQQFESGNLTAWCNITEQLLCGPGGSAYVNDLQSDLTTYPGWLTADEASRGRLVTAARAFVVQQGPVPQPWSRTRRWSLCDLAGYRALHLLLKIDVASLASLPASIWQEWLEYILWWIGGVNPGEREAQQELVGSAYRAVPEYFISTLMRILDTKTPDHLNISALLSTLARCWDDRLTSALLEKVEDPNLPTEIMGALLQELLEHSVAEAEGLAVHHIRLRSPIEGEECDRAVVAAAHLLMHRQDSGWSIVWPAVQADAAFGREVFAQADRLYPHDELWSVLRNRLAAGQLAEMYLWLVGEYPYREDLQHASSYSPVFRDRIADWRDSLLRTLENRGDAASVAALGNIAAAQPASEHVRWAIVRARELLRQQTWVAPTPREIRRLIENADRRLVRSATELLAVITESLDRLQQSLVDETPAAYDLWNEVVSQRGRIFTPKDENRMSDYVKRHLKRDLEQRGVVVNREVVIRDSDRTDIHVDAVIRNNELYDPTRLIIETKGCWNDELYEAMETQLVDRYLKDNECRHGLYLVGWFICEAWDKRHYMQKVPTHLRTDYESLSRRLAQQAAELSQDRLTIRAYVLDATVE